METIYQTVAQNILKLRKEANFSQLALAINADIALKTIRSIECANGNCTISTLEKITDALGVSIARLFVEESSSLSRLDYLIELLMEGIKRESFWAFA